MRSRYPYRKQIKTDYETQFLINPILNDKIKKIFNIKSNLIQSGLTH
jgi:hypothetical protein